MTEIQQAFKGKISLSFKYKKSADSKIQDLKIEPERITYIIIEHRYLNTHILPIVYVSVRLDSDMYSYVMNTQEYSKFHLKIEKRDVKSNTSIYNKVVDDVFSYVSSSTTANYASQINKNAPDGSSYMGLTIGLVSSKATNILRRSFNGIYKNTTLHKLIKMSTSELPNLIMEDLKYDKSYDSILIPPQTSIYKFLNYMFNMDAFYDSQFMLYIDFNKSYLLSNHAKAVDGKDGKPTTVIVDVKSYTVADAYKEGFIYDKDTKVYKIFINASNTQVIVNNATNRIATNIIGYSENSDDIANLNLNINNSDDNTAKKIYLKTNNAALIKNELESSSVILEITKQNLDSDIFTPNKLFKVNNYSEYSKYDGNYKLMYKKEIYYQTASKGEFIVTSDIGLRLVKGEEMSYSIKDTTSNTNGSSTKSLSSSYANKTVKASRKKS